MAKTLRAIRIAEHMKQFMCSTTFEQKVLHLRAILAVGKLGRPSRRWFQKQILQMQMQAEALSDADQAKLLELLERKEIAPKKSKKKSPAASTPATPEGGKSWLDL